MFVNPLPTIFRSIGRAHRSPFAGVAIGLVIFSMLFVARSHGWLQPLELGAYDRFVQLRAALHSGAGGEPTRVVIVRIREEEIERFRHPISDGDLARGLSAILAQQPRAVGVDLLRTFAVGEGLEQLASVVRGDPRVVFVFHLAGSGAGESGVSAPAFARETGQIAASDVLPDPDGLIRRALVFRYDANGKSYRSLAWWLAAAYLSQEPEPIASGPGRGASAERRPMIVGRGELWRFEGNDGGYVDANDGDYQVLIDYEHGSKEFPSVTFSDLIDGQVASEFFRDRVVIVGTTAPSVKDDFFTPIGPVGFGSPVTKGVELHAQIVNQLLRTALVGERPLHVLSDAAETAWLLAWCLVWGIVGNQVRSTGRVVAAVVVGLAFLVGSFPLFLAGWWTPIVPPALAWVGAGGLAAGLALLRERRDRSVLDRMLTVNVGTVVRDRLWQERDRFLEDGRLRAQRACATVLMTDLENFTDASERLGDPGLVMRWLNEYMDQMVPLIESHGGVVDDYRGDAIKADFGVPVPRETEEEIDRDATNAVRCALAMGDAMRELILAWRARGLPPVRMRIGIFTGAVVCGSQGSRMRQKYTSLGDTVNTAARLESFDKEAFLAEEDPTACRILIGAPTRIRIGNGFRVEPVGSHLVKGKSMQIEIYRVLGVAETTAR